MKSLRSTSSLHAADEEVSPLTPMIDIVFQLLVYFVFTFEAANVLTNLQVYTPTTPVNPPAIEFERKDFLNAEILPDGQVALNNRVVSWEASREMLRSLGELNPNQTVIIRVDNRSEHGDLIRLLDQFAEANMINLSLARRG